MRPIFANILEAIGDTPLIALKKSWPTANLNLYVKLEGANPAGSAKDRAAHRMITEAIRAGALRPGATVVESSSGNMAIGLAQVCCCLGLHLICVVDSKTNRENTAILRAYGAEVVTVTAPDAKTGEFLPARLERVRQLLREVPNSFWPNQYANESNPRAHHNTMQEILDSLQGHVDVLICPTSTCGTIRGCYEYARKQRLAVEFIAVDAVGSVIFGGQRQRRLLPGHGSAVRPALADGVKVNRVVYVDDSDCVAGCRHLVQRDGILAGASSGGAILAVAKIANDIRANSNCVVILPDRGERYLETVYSDEWVRQHFGIIPTVRGQLTRGNDGSL